MDTMQIVLISAWAVVLIATIIMEIMTQELQVFWFSLGSLVAMVLAFINAPWQGQVIVFSIISILGFILLLRFRDNEKVIKNYKTNSDSLIGQVVAVNHDGTVTLNSIKWPIANLEDVVGDKVRVKEVMSTKVRVESVEKGEEKVC